MLTTIEATPGRPTAVGVAPGTTTVLLTGATATSPQPVVGCENPARAARQRYYLYPPGKYVADVQDSATRILPGGIDEATRVPTLAPPASAFTTAAATRVKRVLDPYGSIEALKGVVTGKRRRRLGIVLAPYGDRSPNPSFEMVAATKNFGPQAYCTRRPERGPNYRWWETSAYEPEERNHSMNGVARVGLLCKIAGLGCPRTPLGANPTDLQLSSQYQYTPVVSQWMPFKQGMYSPAPWVPPYGRPVPNDNAFMTPWGKYAAPAYQRPGVAGPMADVSTDNADVVAPDTATSAIQELRFHQDRMYMLGIISAAAVASTALINVFRYGADRRDARKRHGRVAAEPAPSISGARRRRRR